MMRRRIIRSMVMMIMLLKNGFEEPFQKNPSISKKMYTSFWILEKNNISIKSLLSML
jgi:hypothetical protein